MNRLFLCAILAHSIAVAAPPDQRTWKWQQELPVATPGLLRLELPPQTLDVCQPDLADLRVISPDGAETPYLLDTPPRVAQSTCAATEFKAVLAAGQTILEASNPSHEAVVAVTLITPARDFLKSLKIEAANADGNWQTLNASDVIFHDPCDVGRLTVPVTSRSWKRLRVTIDDQRTLPIPFTGMTLTLAAQHPPAVSHPVSIKQIREQGTDTIIELDLGAANLMLGHLSLQITDAVFMRHCSLAYPSLAENGELQMHPLGQHQIYRVVNGDGSGTSQMTIPVDQRVPSRQLWLTIHHRNNPRLDITAAEATRTPTELVFHAAKAGSWQILASQPQVGAPDYDITRLRNRLGSATRVVPGPLTERKDYIKPSILPDIDPQGAAIDLAPWSCRKPVVDSAPGLIRIELDAEILANAQTQLADLRLIQDGRQIPFVISPATRIDSLSPGVNLETDAQPPTLSRWRVEMPVENLPALRVTASSSSPLFSRRFEMSWDVQDGYGNTVRRSMGYAQWTKTIDTNSQLSFDLDSTRLPTTFILETDNGDNPAITLENVRVEYKVPSILAKITDAGPLYLYYGNPDARAPRYDLNLASATLRGAPKASTSLGAQEMLKPSKPKHHITSGSPWLWLALGSVVVILLVVVAKLLPKQATTT